MTNSPEICGFYSITPDGEYEDTVSSLRYFIQPRLPIDLNKGIEDLKEKSDAYHERKLNRILRFIVNHKREFVNKNEPLPEGESLIPSAQYITSRSVLRMIMCAPVLRDSWNIVATKYKGNIYLCKYRSEDEINEDKNSRLPFKNICNHGPMFEHHCLSDHPDTKPDTSEICDANTQFFCVFKRALVNREFLYAGEMDGTDNKTPLDPTKFREWKPNQFIELKMNYELTSRNRKFTFENIKAHKIWAQSYLAGVERIYIGFRDNNGLAKQIRCYSTKELGQISKRNWSDSRDGFEYLDHFLNEIEAKLKDIDCPYTTIKYSYNSNFKELSSTMHKGKTEYTFLPEWYLEEIKTDE